MPPATGRRTISLAGSPEDTLVLVGSALEENMLDDRPLVPIATFENLSEAEVARSLLMAEGIEVAIRDQPLASLLPAIALANGGLTLLVGEEEAEKAHEVLAKPDSMEEPEEEKVPVGTPPPAAP